MARWMEGINTAAFIALSFFNSTTLHTAKNSCLLPRNLRVSSRISGRCFFCDVLEHLLVQEPLGDEPLEAIDLELQLSAPAVRVDLIRVVLLSPPVIGRLGYADLATDVRGCQSLGQIAVCFAHQSRHFLGGPSPSHRSL